MTDRELLELAAKAAGHTTRPDNLDVWIVEDDGSPVERWNPLMDDAQALRLAVKLKIWLRYRDGKTVDACWYDEHGFFAGNLTEEFGSLRNGDEPNAAVRRAIVRTAARIGKEK